MTLGGRHQPFTSADQRDHTQHQTVQRGLNCAVPLSQNLARPLRVRQTACLRLRPNPRGPPHLPDHFVERGDPIDHALGQRRAPSTRPCPFPHTTAVRYIANLHERLGVAVRPLFLPLGG